MFLAAQEEKQETSTEGKEDNADKTKTEVNTLRVYEIHGLCLTIETDLESTNVDRITDCPGPEVIKLFSCSAQLRLKFILLINVKMPTIVGILTFISRINYRI